MSQYYDAVVGVDYTVSSKLVSFPADSRPGTKQNVSIVIPLNDNVVESTESFQLHLTSLSSLAVVRSNSTSATVYITDKSCKYRPWSCYTC